MGTELNVTTRQLNILAKKGICSYEDVLNLLPKGYVDFKAELKNLKSPSFDGRTGYVLGVLTEYRTKFNNGRSIISARVNTGDGIVFVNYIGQYDMQKKIEACYQKPVAVFGSFQYSAEYGAYSMLNPLHFINRETEDYRDYVRLEPMYKKFSGISEATMEKLRFEALNEHFEYNGFEMPKDLEVKYFGENLMDTKAAFRTVHFPKDEAELYRAKEKLVQNELWTYALKLEKMMKDAPKGTTLNIRSLSVIKGIADSLPYELTVDQKETVNSIIKTWKSGLRAEGIIQGDVGCGKTLVAILLLFAVAENGGQAIITAPTEILAEQHFEQIKTYADRFHIPCAFLGGKTKARERKGILAGAENGELKIIVGTQALCSDKLIFRNLQLAIIDEEHRFGVAQKEALSKYRNNGCSVLKMSATPIPRTLQGAITGTGVDIFSIKSMPSGRSPIQTAKCTSDTPVFSFAEKQLGEGRQVYVVCPLIEESESEAMESVVSAEEAFVKYQKRFEPQYKVALLNGKMKKEEMEGTIESFKRNEVQILVSTTVIEVGVNVPNSSLIVIENAERFGLASLHQLRGRVGRGQYKGYCVLKSPNANECERLQVMCDTTDGFVISEEDLRLRGAGDLVGTEQSGISKTMELIMSHESMYNKIKKAVSEFVEMEVVL